MNRYLRRAHVKDRSHTQCVKRAKKRLLQQQGKKNLYWADHTSPILLRYWPV